MDLLSIRKLQVPDATKMYHKTISFPLWNGGGQSRVHRAKHPWVLPPIEVGKRWQFWVCNTSWPILHIHKQLKFNSSNQKLSTWSHFGAESLDSSISFTLTPSTGNLSDYTYNTAKRRFLLWALFRNKWYGPQQELWKTVPIFYTRTDMNLNHQKKSQAFN